MSSPVERILIIMVEAIDGTNMFTARTRSKRPCKTIAATSCAALLRAVLIVLIALGFSQRSLAQPTIEYRLSITAPQTQMADVEIRVSDVDDETLDFCLPAWRPGRYTILDFASGIRNVYASTAQRVELPVEKIDKSTWRVQVRRSRNVVLHYRVYANSLADRTRHIDDTHAFISGESVFMYVPTLRNSALRLIVTVPERWNIATGLESQRPGVFTAPSYDVLIDCPLEIGTHRVIPFAAAGRPHELVIWGPRDLKVNEDQVRTDLIHIIDAQRSIFGNVPYERYLFILHVAPGIGGGTEHLNSTVMQIPRSSLEDDEGYKRFVGLAAHEYFHTWNVKQFRPAGLHPYDLQHENYTDLLWFAEGGTSYLADLTLVRTGLKSPDTCLGDLGSAIDSMRRKPGELLQSVAAASFDAWIHFGRSTPDDVNSSVSIYGKGALVSMLLDLEIRRVSDNRASMDQVMRELYRRFPLSGPGYTLDDLLRIVNEVSSSDFKPFFDRYITAAQPLGFDAALRNVGLELAFVPAKPRSRPTQRHASHASSPNESEPDAPTNPQDLPQLAYLGLQTNGSIVASVLSDGPAYAVGLIAGDEILAIDNRKFAGDIEERLRDFAPGQVITITYFRRDELRNLRITLGSRPNGSWTVRRIAEVTDAQKQAYQSWLGQPWPE